MNPDLGRADVQALRPPRPVPLALSRRSAARLLKTRPATIARLVQGGLLREVPWGEGRRIPREEVERLAREGFTFCGRAPRRRTSRRAGSCDPAALRALDLDELRRPVPERAP